MSYSLSSRANLSKRELEILQAVAFDLNDDEIATNLNISIRTVNSHLRHIYAVLGVRGRAGAVAKAISSGLITIKKQSPEEPSKDE